MSTYRLGGHPHQLAAQRSGTAVTLRLVDGPPPAVAPPLPEPPPPVVGDYALIAQLAQGGMSSVYLGQHCTTGARAAIKLPGTPWIGDEAVARRLLTEHTLAHAVHHAGVVRIDEAGRTAAGLPYLVMELLDGENLGALLDRGPLAIGAAVAIAAQVADAAAAIHDAGLVHCDLKPDNVMLLYHAGLAGWPAAKVVDFGVARRAGGALEEIAGTPGYMAPEQWAGHVEARTDVYALGCTLYELVTGATPFEGSVAEMRAGHCDQLPVPPSAHRELPEELERLIMRMLAKDLRMRPRMADVARALTELAFAAPPGARLGGDHASTAAHGAA
ncbi:MAG: serine/threonine protein kinase [Myxococcales bacterium]|nr:serine/threonine protein kinase [Myxococcales bacterium]